MQVKGVAPTAVQGEVHSVKGPWRGHMSTADAETLSHCCREEWLPVLPPIFSRLARAPIARN